MPFSDCGICACVVQKVCLGQVFSLWLWSVWYWYCIEKCSVQSNLMFSYIILESEVLSSCKFRWCFILKVVIFTVCEDKNITSRVGSFLLFHMQWMSVCAFDSTYSATFLSKNRGGTFDPAQKHVESWFVFSTFVLPKELDILPMIPVRDHLQHSLLFMIRLDIFSVCFQSAHVHFSELAFDFLLYSSCLKCHWPGSLINTNDSGRRTIINVNSFQIKTAWGILRPTQSSEVSSTTRYLQDELRSWPT